MEASPVISGGPARFRTRQGRSARRGRNEDARLLPAASKALAGNVGAGGRRRQYRGFRAAQSRKNMVGASCPFCTARVLAL